jgi:hypothetical protein
MQSALPIFKMLTSQKGGISSLCCWLSLSLLHENKKPQKSAINKSIIKAKNLFKATPPCVSNIPLIRLYHNLIKISIKINGQSPQSLIKQKMLCEIRRAFFLLLIITSFSE